VTGSVANGPPSSSEAFGRERPRPPLRPLAAGAAAALPGDVPAGAFVAELVGGPAGVSPLVDHVPNTELLVWIDAVAAAHAASVGQSRDWLVERGLMWFVARHEIDYLAEVHGEDHLLLATWVDRFGRTTSWRRTEILRPSDAVTVGRASTRWVLVDLRSRRPSRIPDSIRGAFQLEDAAGHG